MALSAGGVTRDILITVNARDNATPALTRLESSFAGLSKIGAVAGKLDQTGAKLMSFGRTATAYVTVPLVAAGAASVALAAQFQFSMEKLVTLVGLPQRSIPKLTAQVLSLARATGQSPNGLATALYFITSSGLRGARAMDVLTISAKASAAGMGDAATIAQSLTFVTNAYGKSAYSASRNMDIFIRATQLGEMSSTALASAIGPVLGVAAQAGVTFDQLAAAIASASRQGIPVTRMVTSLRYAIQNLLVPSSSAGQAIQTKLWGSLSNLRNVLADPSKGLLYVLTVMKQRLSYIDFAKALGGTRAMTGALTLVGKNASSVNNIFHQVANTGDLIDRAFSKASGTAQFKLHQAFATLQTDAIQLGFKLLPFAEKFLHTISGWFDAFNKLSPGMQNFILKLAAILAALGPLSLLFGGLFRIIAGSLKIVQGLGLTFQFLVRGASGIVGAFKAVFLSTVETTAAVTGLTGAEAGLTTSEVAAAAAMDAQVASDYAAITAIGGVTTATEVAGGALAGMGAAISILVTGGLILLAAGILTALHDAHQWKDMVSTLTQAQVENSHAIADATKNLNDWYTSAHKDAITASLYARALHEIQVAQNQATIALRRQVAAVLNATDAGKKWVNWVAIANRLTLAQKIQVSNLLTTYFGLGGKLNDTRAAMIKTDLATGNLKDAVRLLNSLIVAQSKAVGDAAAKHQGWQHEIAGVKTRLNSANHEITVYRQNLNLIPNSITTYINTKFNMGRGLPSGVTQGKQHGIWHNPIGDWFKVGEAGPETMFVPQAATIYPADGSRPRGMPAKAPAMAGASFERQIINNFYGIHQHDADEIIREFDWGQRNRGW